MLSDFCSILCLLTCVFGVIECAPPINVTQENEIHDYSKFDTVYDQRQNGTDNIRVSVKEIAIMFVPAFSLSPLSLLAGEFWKSNSEVNKGPVQQRMESIAVPTSAVLPKSSPQLMKENIIVPIINATNITPGSVTATILKKGTSLR